MYQIDDLLFFYLLFLVIPSLAIRLLLLTPVLLLLPAPILLPLLAPTLLLILLLPASILLLIIRILFQCISDQTFSRNDSTRIQLKCALRINESKFIASPLAGHFVSPLELHPLWQLSLNQTRHWDGKLNVGVAKTDLGTATTAVQYLTEADNEYGTRKDNGTRNRLHFQYAIDPTVDIDAIHIQLNPTRYICAHHLSITI